MEAHLIRGNGMAQAFWSENDFHINALKGKPVALCYRKGEPIVCHIKEENLLHCNMKEESHLHYDVKEQKCLHWVW